VLPNQILAEITANIKFDVAPIEHGGAGRLDIFGHTIAAAIAL